MAVDIPRPLAQELWRQSEMKGEAVRLDRGAAEEVLCAEPKEPSVFASTVAECMPWTVTSSYSFRETSHVNLQELRALRREVIRLVARGVCLGTVLIALNDSRVVVGAVAKGRSSSFKLNGLLRGMLPHLVMGRVSLGVLWIETEANPADHPSRFRSLPPPRRVPGWLRRYGVPDRSRFLGLEVGGKEAYITGAHQAVALEMCSPVSAHALLDARAEWIDNEIEQGGLHWVWLAPPCCTFSGLRNLDRGGALRPHGCPEGDSSNPEVGLENALWFGALQLAWKVLDAGGFFILMHPRGSPAWQLPGTRELLSHEAVCAIRVDFCAYADEQGVPGTQKPTRLVTNAPWVQEVARVCPGNHRHPPSLRGVSAKTRGVPPLAFCRELAHALARWKAAQC